VPDGFVICDGSNGTPDLRDRFVPGALNVYAVGEKNGVSVHVHSFTSNVHAHLFEAGAEVHEAAGIYNDIAENKTVTGTTETTSNIPNYYALIFLMKL